MRRRYLSLIFLFVLLTACAGGGGGGGGGGPSDVVTAPSLSLGLPDSLTGGATSAPSGILVNAAVIRAAGDSGSPCFYNGVEDDDILRNGYRMTKFMVSAMATWTCVTDQIIGLAADLPNDGVIFQILVPSS